MKPRLLPLLLLFVTYQSLPVAADVRLPRVFSNQMLLQRGLAVPVWGWADAGEQVTVKFAGDQQQATADKRGRWRVRLKPLKASARGRTFEVTGNNRLVLKDVLVGDVWVCSGQSNMEWATRSTLNAKEELRTATYPTIRLFDVPGHTTSAVARTDVPGGRWQTCSPQSVSGFSAVGYFFGRHINTETGIPVGLIGTNWGGTRIEPWTPPVGFRGVSELKTIADLVDRFDPTIPAGRATWDAHLKAVEDWVARTRSALNSGSDLPTAPTTPGLTRPQQPTAIYNSMVHGLAPYGIRGAIWYQGESNGNEGDSYYHKMRALIEGWRKVWKQKDFPIYFYFVQLADFQKSNDKPAGGDGWARLREAQRRALTIPHTGMAVITDIGQANDIHPRNKQDVGKRLALWALRDVAARDVVVSGPLFREMKIKDASIQLQFDHTGGGLMIGKRKAGLEPTQEDKAGTLNRFAVAGKDKVWHWAKAVIVGNTVIVSCDKVSGPVAVRYGYTMNPTGANLYNREGLPASPFRTDSW